MAVDEIPVPEGSPTELSPAVTLHQLVRGAFVSQMVSVFARLGVADVLASGPRDAEEIAKSVGAHGPAWYRLLRALGDFGVIAELENRRFALTSLGEMLRSDVPGSLRSMMMLVGLPFHRDPWTDLYETIQTGESAFDRVHGTIIFVVRDRAGLRLTRIVPSTGMISFIEAVPDLLIDSQPVVQDLHGTHGIYRSARLG
jgi:hypothetical protein